MDEHQLSQRFVSALTAPSTRAVSLAKRAPTFTADWIVRIGASAHLIVSTGGRITRCETGLPLLRSTRLSINGTARAWQSLWMDIPPPGWHDLFALSKRGEMQFEGDMQLFLAHLQYLKDVLNLPRQESRQ